jgi:hypothetical protein
VELYANWHRTLEKRGAARDLIHSQHGSPSFVRSVRGILRGLAVAESNLAQTDLNQHLACNLNLGPLTQWEDDRMSTRFSKNDDQLLPPIIDHEGNSDSCLSSPDDPRALTGDDLLQRVKELEALIIARDDRITALGSLLNSRQRRVSHLKEWLVALWNTLPVGIQKRIEPLADFIDRNIR